MSMFESWLFGHSILIFSYSLAIAGVAHMLRHRRSPGGTMAWLVTFVALPLAGTALYLVFGGRKLRQARRAASIRFREDQSVPRGLMDDFSQSLCTYGTAPVTGGNKVTICDNGVSGYQHLMELIDRAQNRICLATFIFARDSLGEAVLEKLAHKARNGVDVRVLVDGLGSLRTHHRFFHEFIACGGKFAVFQPVVDFPFRTHTNLRNHRKILVADGRISFAGGMNLTQEDIYPETTGAGWQDLSLVIEGPAAEHLETVFRGDWRFATGDVEIDLPSEHLSTRAGSQLVQILPAGPDVPNDPIYSVSVTAIYRASQRIWIVTPYFVPNDALVEALMFASQRGVDVRILVPRRSNHLLSDLAAASLLRDIQGAGGTVLRYLKGMVHAKAMLVDQEFAAVGSANFDMRSLFLNYEVMQVCYSPAAIESVSQYFLKLAANCESGPSRSGFWREMGEGTIRALSPLF
ncbi:MAG: phospholipase D-like domain-containing protein [Planctomycetaceae bacterium]